MGSVAMEQIIPQSNYNQHCHLHANQPQIYYFRQSFVVDYFAFFVVSALMIDPTNAYVQQPPQIISMVSLVPGVMELLANMTSL